MRNRFDEQLIKLNDMLIEMGALCEDAITYAIRAFNEKSDKMRTLTYEADNEIDEREKEIENLCLKLLLQQQPVAKDLRLISSALKMISDMERIGDQASDIAEITVLMKNNDSIICNEDINKMAKKSIEMVTKSIDSFVKKDISLANNVIIMDDIVDDLFDSIKEELVEEVVNNGEMSELFIDTLMIAKYLERISDHAVNIAEWVIFSMTGEHIDEEHLLKKEV